MLNKQYEAVIILWNYMEINNEVCVPVLGFPT